MKTVKSFLVACVFFGVISLSIWGLSCSSAEGQLKGEPGGQIIKGALFFTCADDGRLYLLKDDTFLVDNLRLSWIVNRHNQLSYEGSHYQRVEEESVQRDLGSFRYKAKVVGYPLKVEENVEIQEGRIRIELARYGEWSDEVEDFHFRFAFPVGYYHERDYIADGERGSFSDPPQENGLIASGIKKLEVEVQEPDRFVAFETDGEIILLGDRSGKDEAYLASIDFPPGDVVRLNVWISLPEVEAEPPALRWSRIGYPFAGEKKVVIEWSSAAPGPSDNSAQIERRDGQIVKDGAFGEPVSYLNKKYAVFDFTNLLEEGVYRVVWSGGTSGWFPVRTAIFEDKLWEPTLDVFIPWNMCHAEVDVGDAAPFHTASHMDDAIRVPTDYLGVDGFFSYDCEGTPYEEGDRVPGLTRGGWYDAGDYDLNIHAQSFTALMLGLAWEEFGLDRDVATLDTEEQVFFGGKPDGKPDILQQIEWAALWLLAMQQDDGRAYVGVVGQPGLYSTSVTPENSTDNVPGTGDERHLYVDYCTDRQLVYVTVMAGLARILGDYDTDLAGKCLAASKNALHYFQTHEEVFRRGSYGRGSGEGRDGALIAALAELYLSTGDKSFLEKISLMRPEIEKLGTGVDGPAMTTVRGNWYAPPFLARIYPHLVDGELKRCVFDACQRCARAQAKSITPGPWPLKQSSFGFWGNNGTILRKIYDAYWLSHVVPEDLSLHQTIASALWIFGLHPLNGKVLVCDIGYTGPDYLFNGQLHGRYGRRPATVPGAVVPGIGSLPGAGLLVYLDKYGEYQHNEACIYDQAAYVFAINALKKAGY